MKTKFSAFIAAIAFLALSVTTAEAQNVYFKKNGATVFQSAVSNIDSIVFKQEIETNYVDIDWNTSVITNYNENTGVVNIQFQGTAPVLKNNNAIVLPQEYGYDIRVITSSTVSGNTITLQTQQGNMSNLFMDTSFTLVTDPSLSTLRSSGGGRIITPSEIGITTEKGYKVLYRKNSSLRSDIDYNASFDIFSFQKDYTGMELYNNKILGYSASWDKCIFDIGLKGLFAFDFGKTVENNISLGDLKSFEFYLDGHLNIDLLLKFIFSASASADLADGSFIPYLFGVDGMTFLWVVGTVPVAITVKPDLCYGYSLSTEGQISISTGCNINANLKAGLIYNKGANIQPIAEFTPSFTSYSPVYTGSCAVQTKASVYPKVEFNLYKFIGPSVALMPYLGQEYGEGVGWSDNINYQTRWANTSVGFDVNTGLNFDFAFFGKDITIPIFDATIFNSDWPLIEEPKRIERIAPADSVKATVGKPVDVSFLVSSYNYITGNYSPCSFGSDGSHGAFVNFETQGEVDEQIVETDANGIANVQWTPKSKTDILKAKIIDKDGQTISEAEFIPIIEDDGISGGDWVLINGVKWATRNVGASSPEDYGIYVTTYEALSYRLPTNDQFMSLFDPSYVDVSYPTLNGVQGALFVDKSNGNRIFMPSAGAWKYDDTPEFYENGMWGYWFWTQWGYASFMCIGSPWGYVFDLRLPVREVMD